MARKKRIALINESTNDIINTEPKEMIIQTVDAQDLNETIHKIIFKNVYCKCGKLMKLFHTKDTTYYYKCGNKFCRLTKKIEKRDLF